MSKIYQQFDSAFSRVSAYVLMRNDVKIGTISFKFPRDGMGRLYCYVHLYCDEMARGFAGGCGYDKQTAAFEDAIKKLNLNDDDNKKVLQVINDALTEKEGRYWYDVLADYYKNGNDGIYILRAI